MNLSFVTANIAIPRGIRIASDVSLGVRAKIYTKKKTREYYYYAEAWYDRDINHVVLGVTNRISAGENNLHYITDEDIDYVFKSLTM